MGNEILRELDQKRYLQVTYCSELQNTRFHACEFEAVVVIVPGSFPGQRIRGAEGCWAASTRIAADEVDIPRSDVLLFGREQADEVLAFMERLMLTPSVRRCWFYHPDSLVLGASICRWLTVRAPRRFLIPKGHQRSTRQLDLVAMQLEFAAARRGWREWAFSPPFDKDPVQKRWVATVQKEEPTAPAKQLGLF